MENPLQNRRLGLGGGFLVAKLVDERSNIDYNTENSR